MKKTEIQKYVNNEALANLASERKLLFKNVMKEFNETVDPIGVMHGKSLGICIRRSFKRDGSYNLLNEVSLN